jgi:hypothetical protein
MTPFSMAICDSECRRLATWVPQLRGEPTAFEPWDGRWPTWINEEARGLWDESKIAQSAVRNYLPGLYHGFRKKARAEGWQLPATSPCPSKVPGWCPRSNVIPFTAADVVTDIMQPVSAFTLRHRQHHVWLYGRGINCLCPNSILCVPRVPYRWPMYEMDYQDVIERFIEVDELLDVPALKADHPEAADMLNSFILFRSWHSDDSGEERWAILRNFLWDNFTRPYLTPRGFQRPLDVQEGHRGEDIIRFDPLYVGFVDKIEIGPCLLQAGIKDMPAGTKDSHVAYLRFNADERGCAARDKVLTKIRTDLLGNTAHQRWARRSARRLGLLGHHFKPAPFTHPALKPRWIGRELLFQIFPDPKDHKPFLYGSFPPVYGPYTPTRRPTIGAPYMLQSKRTLGCRACRWDSERVITEWDEDVQKFEMAVAGGRMTFAGFSNQTLALWHPAFRARI